MTLRWVMLAAAVAAPTLAWAARPGRPAAGPTRSQGAAQSAVLDNLRRIDINNLNMWALNDGTFALLGGGTNVALAGWLIYPKGTARSVVFGSGIWLGAKVNGETRTAVGFYATDYAPGAMVGGTFDDRGRPEYKVYKVAPYTGSPQDTAHVNRSAEELASDPVLDPLLHHSWSEYLAGAAPYGAPTKIHRLPDTSTPAQDDSVNVTGPDVLGDQMLWSVFNDADPANHVAYPTAPLGVEVQQTTFGFNRQGPLGNTVFIRYRIINKGGNQLDSMYVSLWSDPDLGDLGDDLVGCDSTLSLGFVYNADNSDAVYGSAPPAVGYDFFLGPTVGADTLGLVSFNKFINGTDPGSASEIYNYMRGLSRDGSLVVDPTTGQPTNFFHPGDPVTGQGWQDANPADRRFLMSAGPFSMAPGEEQVVVGAIIVGQGKNRLSSISATKFFDVSAQDAFDRNFDLPSPPAAPKVTVAQDHGAVRLCWDAVSRLSYGQPGYAFEGYNLYQGASASGPWTLVATYDEINSVRVVYDQIFDVETGQVIPQFPVAFGSDNGLQFCHAVTQDAIRGGALKDGTEYYYSVTAYAHGADQRPKVLETSQQVIRVMPQRAAAGTDPATASAFPIDYRQNDGTRLPTTDQVGVEVVNPSLVTGHRYEVSFQPIAPVTQTVGSDTATVLSTWTLQDVTTGSMLLSSQVNRRGDGDYRVTDGLQVKVAGDYFPRLKDCVYEDVGPSHAPWGADGLPFFFGGAGTARDFLEVATTLDPTAAPDSFFAAEIRFDPANPQKAHRFLRLEVDGSGDPPAGGRGYLYGGFHDVPFTVWDLARNQQLDVAFAEGTRTDGGGTILPPSQQAAAFDSTWGLFDSGDGGREFIVILRRPYSGVARPEVAQDGAIVSGSLPLMYALAIQQNLAEGTGVDPGDRFRFAWVVPASPNDTISFDTRALVRSDAALARGRLDRIRVVPNPYYNQSRYELSAARKVIRFINMPEAATVRIYNLAGHLARTLRKSDVTTSVLEWDLLNEHGLPVGSGVYIYHVDVPGVGNTTGRMVVFMEKERLSTF